MKCVIYCRVSTNDQTSENQERQLKEYADKQGWQISEIIADIASGGKSSDERQGLKRVFELAHRKQIDIVLFWSLDRFSREGSRQTLGYLTKLDSYGVKWHSFTEEYISSLGIFSDAVIAILSTIAKQERIRISERTKAGLARVRGKVKLGRPKTPQHKIDEAAKLRDKGLSYSQIANELNISKARAYQLCRNTK